MKDPNWIDNIRVSLPRDLYDRLRKLCDHKGQQVHLIRVGVKMVVEREEQRKVKEQEALK